MSTVEEQKSEKIRFRDLPWPVIASVFGLFLLGIAYSLGDAYYRALLGGFWIEADAFPIDKSRHLVLSLWGAFKGSLGLGDWLEEHSSQLLGAASILLMYMAVSFVLQLILRWLKRKLDARRKNNPRRCKFDPLLIRYLNATFWVFFVVAGVIILSWMGPRILAVPSSMGEEVGKRVAMELKHDFDCGCGKSATRCHILVKDGQEVARGYVVAQSATRIALYYNGSTREIPIDGIEIRTVDRALPR
ncbi:hypothetical protein [Burkholderia gladioli]|uniref:hypothetical protein n=1 Tax=Burkholderia gladioli TaxID=28095 RepID=UPI001641D0E5|nr:hypothetical protein [Burkholderia gladioli]